MTAASWTKTSPEPMTPLVMGNAVQTAVGQSHQTGVGRKHRRQTRDLARHVSEGGDVDVVVEDPGADHGVAEGLARQQTAGRARVEHSCRSEQLEQQRRARRRVYLADSALQQNHLAALKGTR